MAELVQRLIPELTRAVPMKVRTARASGNYLEAIVLRKDVEGCLAALRQALGPPVKDFDNAATLEPKLQRALDEVGGIRIDQCLFLKSDEPPHTVYAALWPWASDPERITLRVGVFTLV